MDELQEIHIQKIISWVDEQHLSLWGLRDEMIDHIACEVELRMNEGEGFEDAFDQAIGFIPEGQLQKIEDASLYLINFKFRIMKQLTVISGLIVLATFFLAFFSRIFRPELIDEFLLAGMVTLSLGFIPLFFITNYRAQKEERQKILHILGFAGTFMVAVSAILSYFEVQFSGIIIIVGLVLILSGFFPMFLLNFAGSPYLKLAQGTLILFLFISILSVGFYNVSVSKDMVDYWLQQGEEIELNNSILDKISEALVEEAVKRSNQEMILSIHNAADGIAGSISRLRVDYIQSIDENYESGDRFFSGMDYNHTGKKLINSRNAKYTMKDIFIYKNDLQDLLSNKNDRESMEISHLLTWQGYHDDETDKTLHFLFHGYPAIVNSTILRSIESSVRLSEIKASKYIIYQNHEEAN